MIRAAGASAASERLTLAHGHHRHTAPPNPRDLAASVPATMAALVLEMMAKRPEQRPENALAVRERLRAAMREDPA